MYLKRATIENIRSITGFQITFDEPAGWHVLIGDNGAGKSTIIRSIALALIGNIQAQGLTPNWNNWLNRSKKKGLIELELEMDSRLDTFWAEDKQWKFKRQNNQILLATNFTRLSKKEDVVNSEDTVSMDGGVTRIPTGYTHDWEGAFSSAFGPFRRFEGGDSNWDRVFRNSSYEELARHLSVFNESVALTEIVNWTRDLHHKSLEKDKESYYTLKNIQRLINSENFLPHGTKLSGINSDGIFFEDGNGTLVQVSQLSDGYRSILSLTFELIRQLLQVYDARRIFENVVEGRMIIDTPGVVLIDEIDAHLHPTWQTRIGSWFLEYFPNLQFIVTTHSPLICRAADKGSIWRLAAPGSEQPSEEITGTDRYRLIFGNILDAYGTEVFGNDVSISEESVQKQEQLVKLSKKKMLDDITPAEDQQLRDLKKVFTTDAPIEL